MTYNVFSGTLNPTQSTLKHFSCRPFRMMRKTDDLECLYSVIFHRLCCEFGLVLLTQNYIVHLVNVFIRAGTSRSVAALTSVHCAHVSELLEQPVNATCRPYFDWKCCP